MAEKIIETAYAKINLGLRILGKRPDGYHEVSMIMQSVGLSDEIIITEGEGIQISTNIEGLSCGEDNLAYKAAALLVKEYNILYQYQWIYSPTFLYRYIFHRKNLLVLYRYSITQSAK